MITYRDMTFCDHWRDCNKAGSCDRPLTDEVLRRAAKRGLPISQFTAKPNCHSDFENERSEIENGRGHLE